MNKFNRILVVILVFQLIVAAVILWPRPATSGSGESLLPGVEAEQVVGVTITSGSGQRIKLARSGDGWVLPEADDYPVSEDKVPPLLEKITKIQTGRLVTQTGSSHKRLRVAEDDYERLIELELDDGSVRRLYLGTSPGYSATHVRADGQDQVYLTSELSVQDASAEARSWVDTVYLDIPQEQIVGLTLENANGRFEFEKGDDDAWTMAGLAADETLDQNAVTSLVNKARYTTLLQPLGTEKKAEYGLDDPSAVVTIRTNSDEAGAKTYTLWIGAQNPADNSYALISSESPYYVRVSEFAAKEFVEKMRDDVLELPDTPTPEATPQN